MSFGIDLCTGKALSDIVSYLEYHDIRSAISEKLEEELSKEISKTHKTILHEEAITLIEYLNYIDPNYDMCIIESIGSENIRDRLIRDLIIYNIKQKTKFILINNDVLSNSCSSVIRSTPYQGVKINTENKEYTLFYLDVVFISLNNDLDNKN